MDIIASVERYEKWLRAELGDEAVEADIARKHQKMRSGAFPFLRATYWRWAETIYDHCPALEGLPALLAIGDTHVENFGTWRDLEGRLVWGANDFDDAAEMPYALDLVRLAASALLSAGGGTAADHVSAAIWEGYARGLRAPQPFVLEQHHRWLREAILLPEAERAKWWAKFDRGDDPAVPARFRAALEVAMAELGGVGPIAAYPRSAGTGSLGKPRVVGVAEWSGGLVVREVKAILPSAWVRFGQRDKTDRRIRAAEIADGPARARDWHYRVKDGLVLRRLSTNSRKIELDDAADLLMAPEMLELMGREIANCHASEPDRLEAVRRDVAARGAGWLKEQALAAADAVRKDYEEFKDRTKKDR